MVRSRSWIFSKSWLCSCPLFSEQIPWINLLEIVKVIIWIEEQLIQGWHWKHWPWAWTFRIFVPLFYQNPLIYTRVFGSEIPNTFFFLYADDDDDDNPDIEADEAADAASRSKISSRGPWFDRILGASLSFIDSTCVDVCWEDMELVRKICKMPIWNHFCSSSRELCKCPFLLPSRRFHTFQEFSWYLQKIPGQYKATRIRWHYFWGIIASWCSPRPREAGVRKRSKKLQASSPSSSSPSSKAGSTSRLSQHKIK